MKHRSCIRSGHSARLGASALVLGLVTLGISTATFAADKPNILVLWGDDIGQSNISTYTHGLVGYQTPNIDRIANEGVTFTDYYAEQSCTAGRSSFITGQSVFRTGLSKVGLPGAKEGMSEKDPTPPVYRQTDSCPVSEEEVTFWRKPPFRGFPELRQS